MQNSDFSSLTNVLKEKGEASSLTKGCSMRPMLREHRDVVTMVQISRKLKKGDVVVYDAAWYDQPVIHRIINITDINGTTMYVIKGDNNGRPDPYYVTPEQIKEKVVTFGDNLVVIPKIGYLSLWLRGL